jgi:ribonuclease Z
MTTQAAGAIAHEAGARRIEPFHVSPRYRGQEARLPAETAEAAGWPGWAAREARQARRMAK